jgi:hypothetical protein
MLRPCTCRHEYQDGKHGEGIRVFVKCEAPSPLQVGYRCTVCTREVFVSKGKTPQKGEDKE